MMHFSPGPRFRTMPTRCQVKVYDALEACRIADAKLTDAIEEYDFDAEYADGDGILVSDYTEMQACVRLHVAAMQHIIGGVLPSVRQSAFVAIRDFVNLQVDIPPHLEGVLLAMRLAYASADEAVHLSQQLDPGDVDEGYEVMVSTRAMTGYAISVIDACVWGTFSEQVLGLILKGKPVPTWKELRRAYIHDVYTSGRYPSGEPVWDTETDEPLYMTPTWKKA